MDEEERIVEFHKYCKKCIHETKDETDIPCVGCLDEPVNTNTDRPIYFEEKKGK